MSSDEISSSQNISTTNGHVIYIVSRLVT